MFWIVLTLFVIVSVLLTVIILLQEPKQSGLGEGLGGGGGGQDFGTTGGVAGGLHRMTIYLGVVWGLLAMALQTLQWRQIQRRVGLADQIDNCVDEQNE